MHDKPAKTFSVYSYLDIAGKRVDGKKKNPHTKTPRQFQGTAWFC